MLNYEYAQLSTTSTTTATDHDNNYNNNDNNNNNNDDDDNNNTNNNDDDNNDNDNTNGLKMPERRQQNANVRESLASVAAAATPWKLDRQFRDRGARIPERDKWGLH